MKIWLVWTLFSLGSTDTQIEGPFTMAQCLHSAKLTREALESMTKQEFIIACIPAELLPQINDSSEGPT